MQFYFIPMVVLETISELFISENIFYCFHDKFLPLFWEINELDVLQK
jgi:hypothetical protein